MENPFLIKGYISPEFFCNRESETKKLISAIKNNRDVTLFAFRKLGKTGLIHHLFYQLEAEENITCIYIDIFSANNLDDFIGLLANGIYQALVSKPLKFIKSFQDFIYQIKPVISYDSLTGIPELSFNFNTEERKINTINEIFNFLSAQSKKKKIVIAIDEFQQITFFPEKNTEALLRTIIQKLNNINFIFSGSQKHIILQMFTTYKRPFYHSTELLNLDKINRKNYKEFIISNFKKGNQFLDDKESELILDLTRTHTYYTQYLCNHLFSLNNEIISRTLIIQKMLDILEEYEGLFISFKNLMTDHQWKILKAIAKEKEVVKIYSQDFIKKHDLSGTSSIKRGISVLLEREMIYEENGKYMVYDTFLSLWLERQ